MGLYSRDKGDDPKPVSQRQEASFCDWKAVAQQHMLGAGGEVTSSPKTFCLFCLVFHVMEL